jgi:hypothetical protein
VDAVALEVLEGFGSVIELDLVVRTARRSFMRRLWSVLDIFWIFGHGEADPAEFWQMNA